jgi:aspartyl aminopeptidase
MRKANVSLISSLRVSYETTRIYIFDTSCALLALDATHHSHSHMSLCLLPTSKAKTLAEKACAFLTASTDPFHAVAQSIVRLEAAGFVRLPHGVATATTTRSNDTIVAGGKYYYTVQNSTLVAFAVGSKFAPNESNKNGGFLIIGGHTDSPNLRVKPRSKGKSTSSTGSNTTQLAVECYGGGLWHTWFDRDLSLSGKVLVRSSKDDDTDQISQRLVQLNDPIARVSTLCIHLQTVSEREAFAVNKEEHTSPIIATSSNSSTNTTSSDLEQSVADQINGDTWLQGQEPLLLTRLAKELGVQVNQIADFDLCLYDTQPATIGGLHGEFLYSARLDNLATVFGAVTALCEHQVEHSHDVAMIVCFDHEEVGSVSSHGAGSPVLAEAVSYVSAALLEDAVARAACVASSFCLSIDQAHAIHPNYASKHDPRHAPVMNGGIVIKSNSNQRYTTNSVTGFIVRELGRQAGIPIQEFCGTNVFRVICIGAKTGLPTHILLLWHPLTSRFFGVLFNSCN